MNWRDYCVNGLTPTGDGNYLISYPLFTDIVYCVNGLTPTGDGNIKSDFENIKYRDIVLMALPQQGTETIVNTLISCQTSQCSVNGLTPTGDGNMFLFHSHRDLKVLMALPQQGTETSIDKDKFLNEEVLMALPQQGTETCIN